MSPSQIALFRLLTAIPFFLGFAFGLVRDIWSPLGLRDRDYFRIFVPLMLGVLAWMAFSPTTYVGLLTGMLLTTAAYCFIAAAAQGLTALIGQEALMTGRLSALSNFFLFIPAGAAYLASGVMSESLTPRQIFLLVLAPTAALFIFGYRKPASVFRNVYDDPRAQGATFLADVRRLVRHRAIYPVILIRARRDLRLLPGGTQSLLCADSGALRLPLSEISPTEALALVCPHRHSAIHPDGAYRERATGSAGRRPHRTHGRRGQRRLHRHRDARLPAGPTGNAHDDHLCYIFPFHALRRRIGYLDLRLEPNARLSVLRACDHAVLLSSCLSSPSSPTTSPRHRMGNATPKKKRWC